MRKNFENALDEPNGEAAQRDRGGGEARGSAEEVPEEDGPEPLQAESDIDEELERQEKVSREMREAAEDDSEDETER